MAAGIKIISDTGSLMISSDYTNFYLAQKGTVTLANGGALPGGGTTIGPYAYVYYPNTLGYPPPIAFYSDERVSLVSTVLDGTDWRFMFASQNGRPNGAVVEYFVFAPTPNVKPANFGLAVYRADGSLAFHSSHQHMRVAASTSHTFGAHILSLPATRKYAVMVSFPTYDYSIIPAGTWTTISLLTHYRSFAGGIQYEGLEWTRTQLGFNPTWGGRSRAQGHFLAIDVTDY